MIRDGTYLYSEYWGLRINQSITRAATVPDPVLLTGDFSSIADPLIDPDTGFPFPGNRIPAARMNNVGLALARLYPAPNVFDGSPQNYRAVGTLQTGADAFGFRLDHRLTIGDELFMEYQFNRDTTDDPFNLLGGITNLPSFGVHDALQTQTFRLNDTHVFSAALIDQFRISAGYLKQPRTILGDPSAAVPAVLMTSFSHLGHATNLPQERRSRSFELLNDVSWQHGNVADEVWRYVAISSFPRFTRSLQPRPVSVHRRHLYRERAGKSAARPSDQRTAPDWKYDKRFPDMDIELLRSA